MQRLKRVIRRIAAVGTGVAMLGATMGGAFAQTLDLGNYPAPFIENGVYDQDNALVVGKEGSASDSIGIANIAKELQADSKVCVPGPGGSSVSVSGDAVEISTTSDLLEINESLGDVRETITEVELDGLQGGIVTTNEGTTEFNQYLRFKELNTTINTLDAPKVLYTKNDAPVQEVGDWLFEKEGSTPSGAFFEYELEFEDGLESDIVSSKLDDFRDEEVVVLGTTYTVVDTKVDTNANSMKLELLGGAEYAIMEEGESRTFTIDGKEYEIEVLIIEDVSPPTVTFKINGEVTDQLVDGETEILRDGTLIGVSDIVLNEAGEAGSGDIVEVYIGATKVEFNDNDYTNGESDANLGFNAGVKIDEETIEDAWVQIKANELSSTEIEVSSIKYRLVADALPGSRDIYVPPGHGVREYLDEPQGMLGLNWDIKYEGLDDVGVTIIKLDPAGDDEYNLEFENNQGLVYKFPFISNEAGVFKFGDDNDDLVLFEGNHTLTANLTLGGIFGDGGDRANFTFNIGILDYFILSDSGLTLDDTATTHVVRYNSIDTSQKQVQFDELAIGSKKFIYETTNSAGSIGKAELVFGGNTYVALIGNATTSGPSGANDNPLAVDMNKDGNIARHQVQITVKGGGILNPLAFVASTVRVTNSTYWNLTDGGRLTAQSDVSGAGGTWSNTGNRIDSMVAAPVAGDNITMSLVTLSEDFDENTPPRLQGQTAFANANEVTNWTIVTRTNNRIGLPSAFFSSNGGLKIDQPDEDDDNFYGMTDFGAYVNLFDPEGTDNAETLTIEYPLRQRGARVFVAMGDTETTTTSAGEVCTTADIDLKVLWDDEVTDPTMYNLILVGGPCINRVVEKIDDFPSCEEWGGQYGPGDAIIQLAQNGDHVALLVAGNEADETRAAAMRVEKKQGLSGSLVKL